MTRHNLTQLILKPGAIGETELRSITALADQFPYCQTLQILKTKGMHNIQDIGYADQLKLTAITVSDRRKLYEIIMRETLLQQIREIEKETENPAETVETVKAEPVAIEAIVEKNAVTEIPETKTETKKIISFVKEVEDKIVIDPVLPVTPVYLLEVPKAEGEKTEFSQVIEKNIPLEAEKIHADKAKNEDSGTLKGVEHEERKIPPFKISGLEQEILYEAINTSIQSEVWNDIVEENPEVKTTSSSFEKPVAISTEKDFFGWLHMADDKKISTPDKENRTEEPVKEGKEPQVIPTGQVKNLDQLIDRFIQSDPKISPAKAEFYSPSNVAKLSIVDKEEFVSETLAKIYEKQGYYDKAISVYRKLSLKFPEKNSYFASLIEKTELQKAIDKQKKQK